MPHIIVVADGEQDQPQNAVMFREPSALPIWRASTSLCSCLSAWNGRSVTHRKPSWPATSGSRRRPPPARGSQRSASVATTAS
jgi:hypothetical protein